MISNISTNAVTGALAASPTGVALESTNGRVGPSMAMDSTDSKLFYAYASTGSTEAAMVIREKTFNAAGSVTNTRSTNGISGTTARFSILWAGR